MANQLFHKLRSTLRKQYGPGSKVVPFAVGRIYQTRYRNWKHDPKPLLFVLGSDSFYTVGINVHYLRAYQQALINFILLLRRSNRVLTGRIIYELLSSRLPVIPEKAYRKYFTGMLRGRLVSEGISQIPEPNIVQFIAEPWVRRLNNAIRPKVFSYNKRQVDEDSVESIRDQVVQTRYNSDRSRPFANRRRQRHVVQYRPQQEE